MHNKNKNLIGIALNSAKKGEFVDVALNHPIRGEFEMKIDDEGIKNLMGLMKKMCAVRGSGLTNLVNVGDILSVAGKKYRVYRRDFKRDAFFAREI